jgi:hypothetical protein
MEVMMAMRSKWVAVVVAGAMWAGACGDSDTDTVTGFNSKDNVPQVAGIYTGSSFWVHQVLRTSDGFMKSFTCSGSLTLTQRRGTSDRADQITGFAVVSSPCPPVSFDLTGTVASDGSITFVTGGPKPPEGPCPAAQNVSYSGGVFDRRLNVRGSATVMCPEFGEHKFTYIVTAVKS